LNDNIGDIRIPAPRARSGRGVVVLLAVCAGVAATMAWHSYGDEAKQRLSSLVPQLFAQAPAPTQSANAAEPQDAPESFKLRFHKQKNLIALYLLHAPMRVLPGFLARYVVVDGMRRFARDWSSLPAWTLGVSVALIRAPQFLAQRVRRTCAT